MVVMYGVVWFCCVWMTCVVIFFFFKQKTAYEMRISDWSSDVCSSDLDELRRRRHHRLGDAGAAGIEQVAEGAQARAHAQELVLREIGHLLPRAHRAEHAAHPDPRVAGRRQPRLVAGLPGKQQSGREACRERVCKNV